MTPTEAVECYHRALRAIWDDYADCGVDGFSKLPLMEQWHTRVRPEVLFLGLNPSYAPKPLKKHWNEAHPHDSELLAVGLAALEWAAAPGQGWGRYEKAVAALDRYSREKYGNYYGPIRTLMDEVGLRTAYEHLDLFPLRSTKQSNFEDFLDATEATDSRKWEARERLVGATAELIREMAPNVVVVVNAAASRLCEAWFGLEVQANGHRYVSKVWPETVFLLGSQLSGGATSTYARQRLAADLRDLLLGGSGFRSQLG